jgi:NADPH:quinone reductase-like Zn-dependent oxidoreductase
VVSALGYGTTGLSVGQRVFGLTDSYRGGTLAEHVAVEARNLAFSSAAGRSTGRGISLSMRGYCSSEPRITAWT